MPPYQYTVCDRRFCVTNGDNRRCTCPNGQPRNESVWKSTVFDGFANSSNPDGIDFAWRDTNDEIRRAEAEHIQFVRNIVQLYSTPQYARYQAVSGKAPELIAQATAGGAPLAQAAAAAAAAPILPPAAASAPHTNRRAVLSRLAMDTCRAIKEGRINLNAPDTPGQLLRILLAGLQEHGFLFDESDKKAFAEELQRLYELP